VYLVVRKKKRLWNSFEYGKDFFYKTNRLPEIIEKRQSLESFANAMLAFRIGTLKSVDLNYFVSW
jgi:hypothetical protein